MKITGRLITGGSFLLLGLFGIIQSLTFHFWESIALPLALSGVMTTAAAIEIAKELRHRESQAPGSAEASNQKKNNKEELERLWRGLGWVAGLMLAIYLVGFYITVPLFSLTYLKVRGRNWLVAIIFSVAMLVLLYGIFELSLNAHLFRGLLFGAR